VASAIELLAPQPVAARFRAAVDEPLLDFRKSEERELEEEPEPKSECRDEFREERETEEARP
jgi:hypothetical protein